MSNENDPEILDDIPCFGTPAHLWQEPEEEEVTVATRSKTSPTPLWVHSEIVDTPQGPQTALVVEPAPQWMIDKD